MEAEDDEVQAGDDEVQAEDDEVKAENNDHLQAGAQTLGRAQQQQVTPLLPRS